MSDLDDFNKVGKGILYLRPMDVADLPDELQDEAADVEELFAVHDGEGEQIALVASQEIAGDLAEANDMTLVMLQ